MNKRNAALIAIGLLLGAGSVIGIGATMSDLELRPGRFQMVAASPAEEGGVYVMDTTTGRVRKLVANSNGDTVPAFTR